MRGPSVLYVRVPGPWGTWQPLVRVLADITPVVEALPPDAALAEVGGSERYFDRDALGLGELVRVRMLALYGLDCAVGVGPNPLLARMAAHDGPPGAVRCVADTPGSIAAFLDPKPVAALHGVGPKTAGTLCAYGLDSIGKVAAVSEATLQRILGAKQGRLLHERARGLDRTRVVAYGPPATAGAAWRFDRHETDAAEHHRALLALAVDLGRQLRTDRQVARSLSLTVRYADRSTTTRTRTLPEPSAHTPVLAAAARSLHEALGLQRARVTALSLRAEGLGADRLAGSQLTFDRRTENARRLEPVLDRITARWPGAVRPASLPRAS
ncbi:hypothetical protein [Streptomyces sp. NPDC089919]|uniref:DNA polymerase Y family protein n=1 Tax=Streptomyces sp. NPDC089919 TaxID=3155188 RepID=UPI00343D48FC